MVTIIDVAHYAGVSKSTVSLVLNNSPLVKTETRQTVEQAIKELGYVPNNNARGLIKKENKILGVIISIEDQAYNTYEYNYETGLYSFNITNGIQKGLQSTDYGLLTERFCAGKHNAEIPMMIRNNRVDGVILVGGLFDDDFIDALKRKDLPTVAVGSRYKYFDSVSVDVTQGVYLGVKNLLDNGHKEICYVNCPESYQSRKERIDGMLMAMAEYDVTVREEWIIHCERNTGEGGYSAFKKLWETGARPSAIAAANEPIAMGIMKYLYQQRVRIPDDVSLTAYEASVLGGYSSPAITSVNVSKERMGELAAKMLLERISNREKECESVVIPPELVERDSVCPV